MTTKRIVSNARDAYVLVESWVDVLRVGIDVEVWHDLAYGSEGCLHAHLNHVIGRSAAAVRS